ncbi:MAG: hypothetical protein OEY99_08125, partial [Aigarchaeota archaeon]|nr:hypothetical protein [Aigarchaeota archaeon]
MRWRESIRDTGEQARSEYPLTELSLIQDVRARKVFDSRGTATIEVEVETSTAIGRASAPAGKSRGKAEVVPY